MYERNTTDKRKDGKLWASSPAVVSATIGYI